MANTTRVVFATDLTTADGKHHKGGAEAAVEFNEARDLISRGLVQLAASEPAIPAATTEDTTNTPKGGK